MEEFSDYELWLTLAEHHLPDVYDYLIDVKGLEIKRVKLFACSNCRYGRWTEEEIKNYKPNKYETLIYGINQTCKNLHENINKVFKYASCFIDDENKNILQIYQRDVFPVEALLQNESFRRCRIVITEVERFYEICGFLTKEYHISEKNILYLGEWVGEVLGKYDLDITPIDVRWDLCTICQLDCPECYMRLGQSDVTAGYVTKEKFREFLEINPYVRHIECVGNGEVFLNPDLAEIIRIAYEKQVSLSMWGGVNFNHVTEDVLEALVKYNVTGITVSIDGATQESYEKYRRRGNFDKVIENIEKLNKIKRKHNKYLPELHWKYIVFSHNEDDLEKAVAKADELGIHIVFSYAWGESFKPKDPEKFREITGLPVTSSAELKKLPDIYKKRRPWEYVHVCEQMIISPEINWDGKLYGCCANHHKAWNLNAIDDGLSVCLKDSEYKAVYLRNLGYKKVSNTLCDVCPHDPNKTGYYILR